MIIADTEFVAQKGGVPVAVPTTIAPEIIANGFPAREHFPLIQEPAPQNVGLGPRPSIKGGLPSGPRGGNLPPRRNHSVDQIALNRPQEVEPLRRNQSVNQTALNRPRENELPPLPPIAAPERQNTLGPRPSIRGGLPSGPRGGGGLPSGPRGGGGLPPRRNQSTNLRIG